MKARATVPESPRGLPSERVLWGYHLREPLGRSGSRLEAWGSRPTSFVCILLTTWSHHWLRTLSGCCSGGSSEPGSPTPPGSEPRTRRPQGRPFPASQPHTQPSSCSLKRSPGTRQAFSSKSASGCPPPSRNTCLDPGDQRVRRAERPWAAGAASLGGRSLSSKGPLTSWADPVRGVPPAAHGPAAAGLGWSGLTQTKVTSSPGEGAGG